MCVITLVEKARPSDTQVEQMWDANPRGGGGLSYRAVENSIPVVKWLKGLDRKDMLKLNKELPLPYILHFRQPSNDTSDSLLACHPFQIDEEATTGFEGTTTGWVLFHNGHWNGWRNKMETLTLASGGRIKGPDGPWSDTRAMALCAHHMGFMFLEMANERVLCMGPGERDLSIFGGPWLQVKAPGAEDGAGGTFAVSNRTWEKYVCTGHGTSGASSPAGTTAQETTSKLLAAAHHAVTGSHVGTGASEAGKSGGTSQERSFCRTSSRNKCSAGTQGHQQERVQEASKGPVQRNVEQGQEHGGSLAPVPT